MAGPPIPPAAATAPRPAAERALLALGLCAAVLTWLIPWWVVDGFREVHSAFGADLPLLTRLLYQGYPWLAGLPLLVLAIWWLWPTRRRRGVAACVTGIGGFLVLMPLMFVALSLPTWQLLG